MRKPPSARPKQAETGLGASTRWVLMLPLAAFCGAIAYFVGAVSMTALDYAILGTTGDSDATAAAVASTIAAAATAYAFVWTAVVVAPSSRVRVAQALIGVGSAVGAIAMFDAGLASGATDPSAVQGSLVSGAGFIAGLLAAGIRLRRLPAEARRQNSRGERLL